MRSKRVISVEEILAPFAAVPKNRRCISENDVYFTCVAQITRGSLIFQPHSGTIVKGRYGLGIWCVYWFVSGRCM